MSDIWEKVILIWAGYLNSGLIDSISTVQPDFQTFRWHGRTTMDFLCQVQLRGCWSAATTQPNLLPRISNQYWKPSKISCSKNIFWPERPRQGNIGWWPNIMDACLNMPWAQLNFFSYFFLSIVWFFLIYWIKLSLTYFICFIWIRFVSFTS